MKTDELVPHLQTLHALSQPARRRGWYHFGCVCRRVPGRDDESRRYEARYNAGRRCHRTTLVRSIRQGAGHDQGR